MTLRSALAAAVPRIAGTNARRDAETLLAHTIGRDRPHILAHPEAEIPCEQLAAFDTLITRGATGEPLQYLTGHQEFYSLDFRVTPAVLIPRPETEHLVEAALLWATRHHDGRTLRIADIGTGSGAIAVALATHLAGASFFATDTSAEALTIARQNAATHSVTRRIQFIECDLLSGLADQIAAGLRFDAIVSNPPYIPLGDAPTMQREVVAHEPHAALFAGSDGLEVYRRLIPAARAALRSNGLLALEIGYGQRDALTTLLQGWNKIRFIDDYQGIPRIVRALRP